MPRYKLLIEYDGTPYAGWQRQDGPHTVQQAIETAIYSFCGENVTLITAGRTDSGVHACGAVAHMDLTIYKTPNTISNALNALLRQAGEAIAILAVEQVSEAFSARFSAEKRHYLYKIRNRRAPAVLDAHRVWWVPFVLNAEKMHQAAQFLLGRHDFTTFRAAQCQAKSPVRSLDVLDVSQKGDVIEIRAIAQSFLHNQIRSFAGSLVEVGRGKWQPEDMKKALKARDRAFCGPVAPPDGLYLMQVDYPEPKD